MDGRGPLLIEISGRRVAPARTVHPQVSPAPPARLLTLYGPERRSAPDGAQPRGDSPSTGPRTASVARCTAVLRMPARSMHPAASIGSVDRFAHFGHADPVTR